MYVSYEYAWKTPTWYSCERRKKYFVQINTRIIRHKPTNFLRILLEKPYPSARILENEQWVLSLPRAVSSGSQNINNGTRAADVSGDTLGLQKKASSNGMRYLVNITNKFHVATRNTSSPTRTHKLWNKDTQKKEGTTPTHRFMAHVSALGLVILVYCSMLQQMNVEAKAGATEEDPVNTTTCMPGTYDKKYPLTTKRSCSSPPKFLVIYGVDNNKWSWCTLETWWFWHLLASKGQPISVSSCENITSSVYFLFSEKASLSKWSEIRGFLRIEKISNASLKDVVVLTQFSRDVRGG